VAKVVHLVLNVLTSLLVVRYLGPAGYGDYAKVIVVVGWTSLIGDSGLPKVALRVAADAGVRIGDVIGTVTALRLALSVLAAGVTQLALTVVHPTTAVRVAAAVACLFFVVEALMSCIIAFQVRLQQQYEGLVRVTMELVELATLLTVMARHGGLVALFASPILGGVLGVVLAVTLTRRHVAERSAYDSVLARRLVRLTLPVVPGALLGVLILKLDGLMVAALGTRTDAGVYVAAFQPIEYVFLALGTLVAYPFLPVLVSTRHSDRATFTATYRRATEFVIALTLPVAAVIAVAGTPLVRAMYGDGWEAAVRPMQILALALAFMGVSGWHGFVLLAADRQIDSLRYGTVALLVSFVACLALVGRLGPAGGAWAALLANVAGAAYSIVLVRDRVQLSFPYAGALRLVGATGALAACLFAVRATHAPWPALVVLALPFYIGALWAFRVVTRGDLRAIARRPEPAAVGSPS
jgi:PST family polysaccharide transporter